MRGNETYECYDCGCTFQHDSKEGEAKECPYCHSEHIDCIDIAF